RSGPHGRAGGRWRPSRASCARPSERWGVRSSTSRAGPNVIHTPENWGIAAAWRMPSLLAFIQYSRHTRGVGIMDLDTWVSLGGLLSVGAALIGYIRAATRDLKSELTGHIAKLDTKIDGVRKEAQEQHTALDTKIDRVNRNLDTKITAARKEAKEGNDSLRESMEAAFGRIETRLTSLEPRTYDIKPGTSSQTG